MRRLAIGGKWMWIPEAWTVFIFEGVRYERLDDDTFAGRR